MRVPGEVDAARAPAAFVGAAFDPGRPGEPWRGWPGAWLLVPERTVWIDGDDAGAVIALAPGRSLRVEARRLREELAAPAPPTDARTAARVEREEDERAWAARVERALQAIARGDAEKLVLARSVTRTLERGAWDVARTLERLGVADPRAVRFLVAPGGARGCFLGATPERLVRVCGRDVASVALAGTCPRGGERAEDERLAAGLRGSPKERREHAVVVEAVRGALAPECERLDVGPAPAVRRLRHVQHLETTLSGRLRSAGDLLALAARLHPTPAVAGAPRAAALEWLRAHEPPARGWYAGAVGWLDAEGGGELAVAIRSALVDGPRAWTFAGAGVVPGSEPAAEWAETELKLRTLERALCATT